MQVQTETVVSPYPIKGTGCRPAFARARMRGGFSLGSLFKIVDKARMVMDVQGVEVARLRAKDAQAFRSLVERLQQPIISYLYRLVGDHEVALDLTQDTFLQVYKEIEKTSPDLAVDAWIYRIATNYGLQYLNRKRLRRIVCFSFYSGASSEERAFSYDTGYEDKWGNVLQLSLPGPSVEDQAEVRILVEQAFALLKPKDAACLRLHYGNGLTYEQIGKIIAITPEAVRKRVARGVEKFRAVYAGNIASSSRNRTNSEVPTKQTRLENKKE